MNVHVVLDQLSQQVAAYEATKGHTVVVAGDAGRPVLELSDCLDACSAKLTEIAQFVVAHHATESRHIPQITRLMDRCEALRAARYVVEVTPEAQLETLATRIGATITPEKSADGR